jgi:ribonuclease R
MAKPRLPKPGLPSEQAILDFIQASPSAVGKREIARAFNIKGNDKIGLKLLLKQMADSGKLAKSRRRLADTSHLPPVTVIEVTGQDRDGDLFGVPVEWDEKSGGKAPLVLVETPAGRSEDTRPPARGDRVLAKIEATTSHGIYKFRARVMKTLSDRSSRVLGVYRITRGQGARLVPVDKKARHELQVLAGDENGAKSGDLVEAEIQRGSGRGLPTARVRGVLGDMTDQRNISLIAIHHHAIPNAFPDGVTAEADSLPLFNPGGREDLRRVPLITIDPPDARDHDDAVWAEPDSDPDNKGGVRVIVAIADVAAYVRPGTVLDKEARFRGNSVYFPDRVVPMLPERISNDLCSLREKEERPALAVTMVFDRHGQKKRHQFQRVIMRSAAKLSYEEAQSAIDGRPSAKAELLLEGVLKPLWAAYGVVLKGRDKRKPLELDLPERKIILDRTGHVARVETPPRLDAHKLIEEFMIQANVAAAEELEAKRVPLLYRVHDEPSTEKIRALAQFLKTVNFSLPLGQVMRPHHFNALLEQARGTESQHIVNEVVLRSQAQALYAPQNKGHFGLALRRYAHFTSPIRRYADLIVHRALVTALGFGSDGLSPEDIANLSETADMISDAERRAMAAERETNDRLISSYLAGHTGAVFSGRIGGVAGAGLFIRLTDTGADGFVPVATLGADYFVYDDIQHALIGQRTGACWRLGDQVQVRLVEATPIQGGLRFEMVSEPRSGAPLARRRNARLSRQTPKPGKRGRR